MREIVEIGAFWVFIVWLDDTITVIYAKLPGIEYALSPCMGFTAA
jgi:hypothetical protein